MTAPLPALAAACIVALFTTGAHADDLDTLAPRANAAPPPSGMQSPAAFGIGVFLSSVGAAGVATGAYLFSGGHAECDGLDASSTPSEARVDACTGQVIRQVGGVVALVTGGALFIAGIPMMAVGASSAGPGSQAQNEPELAPRAALLVSPTYVDFVVTF
jgi:hypothetical protein